MRRQHTTPFRLLRLLLLFASCGSWACAAMASDTSRLSGPETISGLGTASFSTSTQSVQAQAAFTRGLLLLHLFEYRDAAKAFVMAEQLDPGFAMAYWGEAMTFNHGVWNQVDVKGGKSALEKFGSTPEARFARIADAREGAYFSAVELLYAGTGSKPERDMRYCEAMERLSAAYPKDRDAQLFYALALLSQSEGVRDVAVYLRAAEIAKTIYRLEPNNPGAAHYWIHGMDDPDHAAGALEAAQALSKIAPKAGHAQHMCSHIFMALGMWDEVVEANVNAMRVVTLEDEAQGFPALRCGHYQIWLEYGYFQQGRMRAADKTVDECQTSGAEAAAWAKAHPKEHIYGSKNPDRVHLSILQEHAWMREVSVIESQERNGARRTEIETSELEPGDAAWDEFANGLAAAQGGDRARAELALKEMGAKTDRFRAGTDVDPEDAKNLAIGMLELSGLIKVQAGHYEDGVSELRRADEAYRGMAFAFGPPSTMKPPAELLGEVLLKKGDARAARESFERSLARAPRRTESLLGLARSERMGGEEQAARKTYQTLLSIWHSADADAPGLEEALQVTRARPAAPEVSKP